MTYEERLAAVQAKMDTLKVKMSNVSEKAKAARTMKKEEIASAIESINADLDDLDAALEEEFNGGMAESLNATADEIDAAVDDGIDTVEGNINAAKENVRLANEQKRSKINSIKLEAQMKYEALKDKIADKNEQRDKAATEAYILDLLDYAEYCQQIAFAFAIEADMALLEAADILADYTEKYGELEIPEAEDEVEAEAETEETEA